MENMEFIKLPLYGKYGVGKFVLVDGDYDGEYFGQYKWYLGKNGYACARLARRSKRGGNGYTYLHNLICPPRPGLWVDHIDRDKLNCRSSNLRWVTPSENAMNRTPSKTRIGNRKYRGVGRSSSQRKGGKLYIGRNFTSYCRGHYLGSFKTEDLAAKAYDDYQRANIKPEFQTLNLG